MTGIESPLISKNTTFFNTIAKNFCFSVLFFIKKKKNVPEKQAANK